MALRFRLDGHIAMLKRVKILRDGTPKEFVRAAHEEFKIEAKEIRKRTPVDRGDLVSTIEAPLPEIKGNTIYATIQAGGAVAPYAIYVHEDLEAFHSVGEAKFIERPLNESGPHMPERIARRVDLKRIH